MRQRRHADEGTYYRRCTDADGCPPAVPVPTAGGGTRMARPEHGKACRARWAYSVDLGIIGGRRTRKVVTARTKAECAKKAADLRSKLAQGVSPTAITVADWLDYWIDKVSDVNPRTKRGYRGYITQYLKPGVGHIKLQDLKPEHIEGLHDWMRTLDKSRQAGRGEGRLSPTTIRQAHMVLRSALAEALARGHVIRNVAAVVRAPKAVGKPHEKLQMEEAKAVLRAARDERELCRLVCALILGVRQGEALGLRWQDYIVDGDRHYLLVEEAIQRIDGELVRTDVKSLASHRRLPLPEQVRPIFAAWRKRAHDAYLFPGPSGGPEDSKRDWETWRDALERAGVPHVPLHGARGSAASLLADMGVPDWMIAEILGHSQVIITRRHYIQGTEERHQEALGGLVAALLP